MKHYLKLVILLLFFNNGIFCQATYNNPILAGFYPDPSICRVGNDYYLVNSTFAYFPGLPIFHSTDLVNWKQIGNAMDRNEQLDLSNANVSGGLFAPTIRYHDGVFYIICTNVTKGGNFIITAKTPAGPWSNPTFTPAINGIDPSLFFDDNGKVYIVYNSGPPDDKALYDGHRTIRLVEYDFVAKKTICDNKIIVNGGTDIAQKPVWIEGPHLYKINGWYYLMCAQGGTGSNHSEVIFRSKSVDGPFLPYKSNPILTQRNLENNRANPITSTGHADLVETPDGKWYAVFLGCRPYESDFYNTGRETFMAPVEWKDDWPIINPNFAEVQYKCSAPFAATKRNVNNFSGNYYVKEEFANNQLPFRFLFLRNPSADLYTIKNGLLELPLKTTTIAQKENPAFIGFRQAHLACYAAINLSFDAVSENEKAGLVVFQNEQFYYFLCKTIKDNKPIVALYKSAVKKGEKEELITFAELKNNQPLQLKIKTNNDHYSFFYATTNNQWLNLKTGIDGKFLSTKTAGGFVGSMMAMYSTSNGKPSTNKALYDWFEYNGNDEIYKSVR